MRASAWLLVLVIASAVFAGEASAQKKGAPLPKGQTADDLLRIYDKDGDGRVSKYEWFRVDFDRLDRNHDGVLTAEDFSQKGQPGELNKQYKNLDKDGDGRVTFEEFAQSAPMNDRFKDLDKDGSGFLERPELELIAQKNQAEARLRLPAFIDRFDVNRDGKVTREEFTGPESVFARMDRNHDGVIDEKDGIAPADEPLVPPPPPASPTCVVVTGFSGDPTPQVPPRQAAPGTRSPTPPASPAKSR